MLTKWVEVKAICQKWFVIQLKRLVENVEIHFFFYHFSNHFNIWRRVSKTPTVLNFSLMISHDLILSFHGQVLAKIRSIEHIFCQLVSQESFIGSFSWNISDVNWKLSLRIKLELCRSASCLFKCNVCLWKINTKRETLRSPHVKSLILRWTNCSNSSTISKKILDYRFIS